MVNPIYTKIVNLSPSKSVKKKTTLIIENVDVAYVNALRRVIIADITNVAISEDVNFIVNNTFLHNEFMAHRLSMIPCCFKHFDIQQIHNNVSNYKLVIDVKNNTDNVVNVTTEHIKIYDDNDMLYHKLGDVIFPIDPITKHHILITKLNRSSNNNSDGDHIHAEFKFETGTAKQNSKFSCVSNCSYFNTLDQDKINQELAVLKSNNPTPRELNKFDTIDKYRCFIKNKFDEPVSFTFTIESECRMSPHEILDDAFKVLKNKLLSALDNLVTEQKDDKNCFYVLRINDANHTIGNILQVSIFNNFIREKNDDIFNITYAGYFHPHPLENYIILKLKSDTPLDVDKFVKEVIDLTIHQFSDFNLSISKAFQNYK